jgi:Holliday junction resolvase RusA-like endonuclease
MSRACTITVHGMPAPQGSKRFVGTSKKTGRGLMVESSARVKPWREATKWAALENGSVISGAVAIEMVFTMPKPKSAPKGRVTFPDRKPDIDKLCRSTLDALVSAGTIEDDARVVSMYARKVFPMEHAKALKVPGAVISIAGVTA